LTRALIIPVLVLVLVAVIFILRPEFLDLPSLLLTVGGSIGVILFSYSPRQLLELLQVSRALLAEKPMTLAEFEDELSRLTQLYQSEGLRGLEHSEGRLADPFLRRAVSMLVDLKKEEAIHSKLERDLVDASCGHELSRQVFLLLSKTLPAFGLIGTLMGMVLLLRNLYAQDAQSLPAALSLAVLTTLYGAVFANVLVAPFAARLHAASTEKEIRMRLTIDWAMSLVHGNALPVAATHKYLRPATSRETARSRTRDRGWVFFSPSPQR